MVIQTGDRLMFSYSCRPPFNIAGTVEQVLSTVNGTISIKEDGNGSTHQRTLNQYQLLVND